MRRIIKTLIVMMIVGSLMVSTMGIVFGKSFETKSILHSQTKFEAISATRAEARLSAGFTGKKNVEVVFTLQSAPLNSSNFSDVSNVLPVKESWNDVLSVIFSHEFPISSTKDYRVKMEISDWTSGGIETSSVYYVKLDR